MKDIKQLTNIELDNEIEIHKTAFEKIVDEEFYRRELAKEKLKRLKEQL